MDIRTLLLCLALGNLLFGLVMLLFRGSTGQDPWTRFWITARLLEGSGFLLLFGRDGLPIEIGVVLANTLLAAGFSYECWALFRLTGRRVGRPLHLGSLALLVLMTLLFPRLAQSTRILVASLVAAGFHALAAWALLDTSGARSRLRAYLGGSMAVMAAIMAARGVWAWTMPTAAFLFAGHPVQFMTYPALYVLLLVNGFAVLLLSKEALDHDLQAFLSEHRAILDTLPTGLGILRDRQLERCNPALEAMFRYQPGSMVGLPTHNLFESEAAAEQVGAAMYSALSRSGRFQGEVRYVRRDGEPFWAWVQGSTIFPDRPQAHAVFSVTDITEQKRQQAVLETQKQELQATLARINRLEGIIPICMYCKKIRNEAATWEQLEAYLTQNSDAHFSHGLCPDCKEEHFGQAR